MDRNDPASVAAALVSLDAWRAASTSNWMIVPENLGGAHVATVIVEEKGPVEARLLFFPGFAAFGEFVRFRSVRDYGIATCLLEFAHFELAVLREAHRFEIVRIDPGFKPRPLLPEEEPLVATLLYESYGVILRMEENPRLGAIWAEQKSMFSRREGLDGKWRDAPYAIPPETPPPPEKSAFAKSDLAAAVSTPIAEGEEWQVDLLLFPQITTTDGSGRLLYLFAAVDAKSGERVLWMPMSVLNREPGALEKLWSALPAAILKAAVLRGRMPCALHFRSGRLLRRMRALAVHVPVKLVMHGELPELMAQVAKGVV